MKKALLITIDTEGDGIWFRPSSIATRNARFLPRFQQQCERYGFKPTWLTNYEMAESPEFVEFGRDVIRRGAGEVGMHLHAWNSPPLEELTGRDMHYQPYLIEYPLPVMERKVAYMTHLLEERFGVKMTSHRSGRWALNSDYVQLLIRHGYLVDCSVTPTESWRHLPGDPSGQGGTDYRDFPAEAYFMDPMHFGRVGNSQLLQVPMTIRYSHHAPRFLRRSPLAKLPVVRRLLLGRDWLRPQRDNLAQMLRLVERVAMSDAQHMEFMLHSSEFMPGGSPTFPDAAAIERLFDDMEQLFAVIARYCEGYTLTEFRVAVDRGEFQALRAPV